MLQLASHFPFIALRYCLLHLALNVLTWVRSCDQAKEDNNRPEWDDSPKNFALHLLKILRCLRYSTF